MLSKEVFDTSNRYITVSGVLVHSICNLCRVRDCRICNPDISNVIKTTLDNVIIYMDLIDFS